MESNKVKRGEIYLYDFGINEGSIQSGRRPVIVIQGNEGNQASTTTIVAAITSVIKKRYLPSHVILGENFGLREPSMVLLEQLKTVNQNELLKYIGVVDNEYVLKQLNIGLKKAMGLWIDKPPKKKHDIRCLCGKCLQDYKATPEYIVRRLDPFNTVKTPCDRCEGLGYDYLIIEKRLSKRKSEVNHDE